MAAAKKSPTDAAFQNLSDKIANQALATSSNVEMMDRELLEVCSNGNLVLFRDIVCRKPNILTSVTPVGNNCLHLAAMLGHHDFAKEVWSREPSLFLGTNKNGETPLVTALAAANDTLASDMIAAATQHLQPDSLCGMEGGKPLNEMLLKFDIRGDNVLHHAMRNDFEDLAVQLLEKEPRLSEKVNITKESPMHMAARRGYSKIIERLLNIPSSADCGPYGFSPLHAAVVAGRTDIIKQLLKGRPKQAHHMADNGMTSLGTAVMGNNLEIVKIFLEHDPNIAHIGRDSKDGTCHPFLLAATSGLVSIAEEISGVCPDAAYASNINGMNALHLSIINEQTDFVDYMLQTPKFHRLIHQTNLQCQFPLHTAATYCNPALLRSLLNNKRQDHTAVTKLNSTAASIVAKNTQLNKTLKWHESYVLVSNSIPNSWGTTSIGQAKKQIEKKAIEEVKSLTERYTANTSLVAALLATITFAAAFTLPGGYSSDTSDAGQPIFGMKAAFQVFLISDTIAMCSSLAVVFLCILATWEDLEFLLNYRRTTRALMWCAYGTTAVVFGTGLFTVLAPKNMWLAVLILVLSCILPFVSKIIGEWPLLRLRLRLGHLYQKDLVPNI